MATAALPSCSLCGFMAHFLGNHIAETHGLSLREYVAQFPNAAIASPGAVDAFAASLKGVRRKAAPAARDLTVTLAGLPVPVWAGVKGEDCLPLPPAYRWASKGKLRKDITEAVISVMKGRHTYVWGMPGTGKDAFIHGLSQQARRPAILLSIVPGRDIGPWFYTRAVGPQGTSWEFGAGWRAVTEGYTAKDGTKYPYIVLVTDLDRADEAQVEWLRLLMDGISGRIIGPDGKTVPVFPGTTFVATANTAGGGDERGRMVSARPLDASILDRFDRKYHFHYMEWEDEVEIVREKFPLLCERVPEVFGQMGNATAAIRDAVEKETLYAEFSHRGVCSVLGHAEDVIAVTGKAGAGLLKRAFRAWLDGLPDEATRLEARRLIDPHLKGGSFEEESV
jgi:MoxR-like ATPase